MGILLHCWWEHRLVQPLWKAVWSYIKKLNEAALWFSDSTSGKLSKETQNTNLKECQQPILIAALFTIAKIWKHPKCPSVDKWVRQPWCIYTVECYLAIKKKKILPLAAAWMGMENIMLSEISQSEKGKYHMISLVCWI